MAGVALNRSIFQSPKPFDLRGLTVDYLLGTDCGVELLLYMKHRPFFLNEVVCVFTVEMGGSLS